MSIQGLMALLGHTTPEMTLRYATLASPTLRAAYETAMGRMRPRLPIAPIGKPMVPDRVQWLNAEVLKTRVAHGFCSRELAAEACAYAYLCATCDNYLPATDFAPPIKHQPADLPPPPQAPADRRRFRSSAPPQPLPPLLTPNRPHRRCIQSAA